MSTQPAIASDETGRVVVVWSDTSIESSRPEVYARVSHDKATTLSHVINMSDTEGSSKHAQVVISRDRFYVVWEEDGGSVTTDIMIGSSEF